MQNTEANFPTPSQTSRAVLARWQSLLWTFAGRLPQWIEHPFHPPTKLVGVYIVCIIAAFAAIDFNVVGEINIALLYALCVGLCVWTGSPRFLWCVTTTTVTLTFAAAACGPSPEAGLNFMHLIWIGRTLVGAKLVILAAFAHLWMRRSEQLYWQAATLKAKNFELSEHLRHTQKMEAIGHLTAGIVHDFKNIMAVIVVNLDVLSSGRSDVFRRERAAHSAMRAAESATSLAQRLLAFSARRPAGTEPLRAKEVIDKVLDARREGFNPWLETNVQVIPCLWPCLVDATQFEAAILNLVINAADAMPEGGRLTIRGENATVAPDRVAGLSPGDYIVVSVSDNGPGIPAAVLSRVFEPFFTTKPPSRGSGLGLWMVRNFAEQAGGTARLESAAGTGTTVQLYLPRIKWHGSQPACSDA